MRTMTAVVFALLLFAGCGGPAANGQEAPPPGQEQAGKDTSQEGIGMDIEKLRLKDEDFWREGNRAMDPVVRKLRDQYFGVIVDAPRVVSLAERKTLPVFLYYMGTFRQQATRDFDAQALVLAMDTDGNRLYFAPAARRENPGEPRQKDRPDKERAAPADAPAGGVEIPEGIGVSVYEPDLRALLGIPWRPGEYLVSSILLDMPSNRVRTRLVPSAAQYQDPEVERFLAAERAKMDPPAASPPVSPDKRFPVYARTDDSPPLPETVGIELRVERVIALGTGVKAVLRGSFRLPLMPENLVKPDHGEYNGVAGFLAAQGRPATQAIVGITLLLTSSTSPAPIPLRLEVPSFDLAAGPDGKKTATGYFSVDLLDLVDPPERAQTWFVYAFSREAMIGPVPIGFADRSTLPGR